MNVTESETHRCDIQLEDITEEEYGAMFLEGIRELVSEARAGMVSDYIVLPYEDVPDEIKDKAKGNTWEVSDEDSDALVQIGAVSMIKKGLKVAEEEDYYAKLQKLAEDSGEFGDLRDGWNDDEEKEGM